MKEIVIFLIFAVSVGCKLYRQNCTLTSDKLIANYGSRILVTILSNNRLTELRDKGKDSIEGGYYTFYNNGHLKSYQNFIDTAVYNYQEQYDSLGNLLKIEGIPLLHKTVKFVGEDSLTVKLYFFVLNKVYDDIDLITNDNRHFELSLIDDTLYSYNKVAVFGYNNLKAEKDINAYINVEYEDKCTGKRDTFKDTISLHYSTNVPNR